MELPDIAHDVACSLQVPGPGPGLAFQEIPGAAPRPPTAGAPNDFLVKLKEKLSAAGPAFATSSVFSPQNTKMQ